MNIYLIRHGDAEKAMIGKKDFDREITPSGRTKFKNAAEHWRNIIPSLDYIVTSPFIRAFQTAQILGEVFGFSKEIISDKKLSPGGNTESIIEIANSLEGEEIAFVGHQPDFAEHVSKLLSSEEIMVEFKKGAIAKISFNNKVRLSKGILEFLIPLGIFQIKRAADHPGFLLTAASFRT